MNKFKSIFTGSIIGFVIGVIFSTFLYDNFFRTFFPKIYLFSLAFDFFWVSIAIILPLFIFGGIIGWIIIGLKKESTFATPRSSKGIWMFLIILFIVLFGFYIFTFTTTYECEIKTSGEIQLKDMCYSKKLICDKISQQNIKDKDQCYSTLAELKKDSEICTQILDLNKRNICVALIFGKIAVQESNFQKCELITNQDNRDFCYTVVANEIGWKNLEICEKIISQNSKDSCYFSIAVQLCDESLCEKISNNNISNLKIDCLSAVERDKKDEYRPGGSCLFFQEEREKL